MSAKDEYSTLISEYQLSNALDLVDIGYSNKVIIIKKLLENFTCQEINTALDVYQKYVAIKKYNLPYIYNTLSAIIKNHREKKSESVLQKM
jgi:hypothetical protein